MQQKSTYENWQKWAKILDQQLKLTLDVYAEHNEGNAAAPVRKLAERLELFIDPVKNAAELALRNYDVKGSVNKIYLLSLTMLQSIFREALTQLPKISADMQRLLKSPCFGNCVGRVASDIFKGPRGEAQQGIGNGEIDVYGFLPWMLAKLIEEADVGGEEYFQKGLDKESQASSSDKSGSTGGPQKFYPPNMGRKTTATGVQ
jgi:hypothetical protein